MLNSVEQLGFFYSYCHESSHDHSLHDFSESIVQHLELVKLELNLLKEQHEQKLKDVWSWLLYKILSIFGGIYAFFSGFDGMIAVLSVLFPMLNLKLMILVGLVSAFSSLGVFLARDKLSIAETLNISKEIDGELLDDYLFYLSQHYNFLYQESFNNPKDLEILNFLVCIRILKSLLEEKSALNIIKIQSWLSQLQTHLILMIGAILFFSDGFFIGQGLALFLVQAFTLNASIWVLCLSIFVGLTALSGYWFVEKPYVEKYLYQELITDEEHVQQSLSRLDDMLKMLEKLVYVLEHHDLSKRITDYPCFCSAATAGKVSPSK
ncbi:MAG: hypothetical protein QG556_23 [Pseudomonadota bacterium]|nr:hypothetical protein [Pseudomonadota bacterium]